MWWLTDEFLGYRLDEMNKGAYIVFEGPGYSGKSTVMRLVAEDLRNRGFEVVVTREPGGCPEAEDIRKKIFELKSSGVLSAEDELELFYLARAMNMERVVKPAIEKGALVLKDRDQMSSFLYQVNSGLDRNDVINIHREMFSGAGYHEPDLRLMLYINEETLRKRVKRGSGGDPFDEKALEMLEMYGAEALNILRRKGFFAGNTEVVDANWPIETVKNTCLRLIERRLDLEEDVEGKRRRVEY